MKTKRVKAKRTSLKIKRQGYETGICRLKITKKCKHFYAQVIHPFTGAILAVASTLEFRKDEQSGTKQEQAKKVGQLIGERAKQAGIAKVAFDRAGCLYHGRVKACADGAREFLEF